MNLVKRAIASFVYRTSKKYKMSYAQCGEDLIVAHIFDVLCIGKPTYLDIGAHHATFLSNTYLLYKNGCKGVCIEPDPTLCAHFKAERKRDICLNVGIGVGIEKDAPFYFMSATALNTFSKKEAESIARLGKHKIEKVLSLPLISINEVIEENFNACPNFVSLDVEGLDVEILKSLDFEKHRPQVFCVETLTFADDRSGEKIEEIGEFMLSKGYFPYADTFINTIFVDKEAWNC